MKEEIVTDALLREFLLGNVNEDERERIENLFLTDSELRDRVLAIEQDLIEAYLEDSLTGRDKERFLSLFAQTDEQRRRLRITKSIKDLAVREARAPQIAAAKDSAWSRFWRGLRLKPRFVVLIAVTIVIAIVLGIVWLNREVEQRRHLAVERELARLNSPTSLREAPSETIVLELRPVSVRSVEPQAALQIRSGIRYVELRLPWIRNEHYSTYQAELRRQGAHESFRIPNVRVESNTIQIILPAQMLSRGDYQINVTGIAADGSASSSEEYTLAVTD